MLQSLLSAIVDMLLAAAIDAVLEFFGWKHAAELVAALFGLSCIVIGFAILLLGH